MKEETTISARMAEIFIKMIARRRPKWACWGSSILSGIELEVPGVRPRDLRRWAAAGGPLRRPQPAEWREMMKACPPGGGRVMYGALHLVRRKAVREMEEANKGRGAQVLETFNWVSIWARLAIPAWVAMAARKSRQG